MMQICFHSWSNEDEIDPSQRQMMAVMEFAPFKSVRGFC